ncbi:extracellular solute-binding protein [Vineibacter terrae]|uniref:extracellular solute-binding protein n=1 Tax=Vineibacter terrae TaxID=2586908 RepID=UPI002E2F057D|nr:extracellular solute-binding protein [Vineibacter terrae]HEX2889690.1 extracellular solute-binding protein [Vineibacter terrae]
MIDRFVLKRRAVLHGAAASAGVAALALPASAQAKKVVVGTWGGDYSRLLAKNIEAPLLIPKGWEVVKDEAQAPPRKSKVQAEKPLRRGTTDIQALSAGDMYDMEQAGVLEKIDYSKIPNAVNLLPEMRYAWGLGHIYSGKVILYNPKLIATPPTSFAETLDPKHGSKLGIIDIQYQYTMMAAAMASGGSMSNYEPGKARLLECRKAGARIYPTNEALAQGLKNEEIGLCIMWKARAVQWQNAGIEVQTVAAKEGVPLFVSGFCIPKNAPNKEGAYTYLDAMLAPSAQEAFAVDMGYNPTVKNAKMAPDLQKRVGFDEAEQARLMDLDYGYLSSNDTALKEWWDKTFKG